MIAGVIYGTPLNLDTIIIISLYFMGLKHHLGSRSWEDLIIVEASIFQRCPCIIYSYVVIDLWGEEWFSREEKEEFVEELEQQ